MNHRTRARHPFFRSVGVLVFGAALLMPLTGRADEEGDGVRGKMRRDSIFMKLVSPDDAEKQAIQYYQKEMQSANQVGALVPERHPQLLRLRKIAERMLPYTEAWNPRARDWKWEVNIFASENLNAFCMAGGKIAFYSGILEQLQLTDDEVAAVMGHEIAHALREHTRRRAGQGKATQIGAVAASKILGLHEAGNKVLGEGARLLILKFSREDELEADILGMELASRAGYDPSAGITLWQKMAKASENAKGSPEFLSTHPMGERRIQRIEELLPKVMPIYEKSEKPVKALAASFPRIIAAK